MTTNTIPTPGPRRRRRLSSTSGFRGNALLAVKLAEARRATSPRRRRVAWRLRQGHARTCRRRCSTGEELYFLKSQQRHSHLASTRTTGERRYGPSGSRRVPNVYASPVGPTGASTSPAATGQSSCSQRGPELKVLATNRLDDGFDASPAVVEPRDLPARRASTSTASASSSHLRGRGKAYRMRTECVPACGVPST